VSFVQRIGSALNAHIHPWTRTSVSSGLAPSTNGLSAGQIADTAICGGSSPARRPRPGR
jgi:hypothetical protein